MTASHADRGGPTSPGQDRETRLIALMRAAVPGPEVPEEGPGDDCAALPPQPGPGRRVLTTDALIEGVHFLRAHPPRWLGYKTLAVNTSDVTAMGARPEGFVLAAALPRDTPDAWWVALAEGLAEAARDAGCVLVGGDVVSTPGPIMLTVTAWGTTRARALLRRDGARPGQDVWLAGAVGRARVGLARWLARAAPGTGWPSPQAHRELGDDPCLRAHLRPSPPLSAGPAALAAGATAGMDVSDGIVWDAARLGRASSVVVVVDAQALPEDPALDAAPDPRPAARSARERGEERLRGGEDYALLVTAPPAAAAALGDAGFHRVGWVRAAQGEPPGFEGRWGREVLSRSELRRDTFDHFGREGPARGRARQASKLAEALGPS